MTNKNIAKLGRIGIAVWIAKRKMTSVFLGEIENNIVVPLTSLHILSLNLCDILFKSVISRRYGTRH